MSGFVALNNIELDFIRTMNQHSVRHIIIGGHAVIFHGHSRPTKDLDIWIEATKDNLIRVSEVASSVGHFIDTKEANSLASPAKKISLSKVNADLLTSLQSLNFEESIKKSIQHDHYGIQLFFLNKEDLIFSKQSSSREIDQEDIKALNSNESEV